MAFISDLSKLMERGTLDIDGPVNYTQSGPSIDIPVGDIFWIDGYKLDSEEDDFLKESGRTILGEAEYIAFTKWHISLSSGYELYVDPRSSLARLGLQVSKFKNDYLSKIIDSKKLPEYKGRIPLVVRTMRTNLFLPEDFPAIQLLVTEKNTTSLNTNQLIEVCKNHQVEVLRNGKEVEPKNDEFPLTFHPIIKRYQPSSHIFFPYENTEKYFNIFDMSKFSESFSILEDCFHLGSTAETTIIDNKHLGMLTHNYPQKWSRYLYRYRDREEKTNSVLKQHRWLWSGRELVEEWVEPSGYVHLTPWIKPGSNGNQTLEIAAKAYSHNIVYIYPGADACSLKIFELDDECIPYNGRYKGQDGPSVSRLYKNSI